MGVQDLLSLSCAVCGIVRHGDWPDDASAALSALNQRKRIKQRARGSVLFHQGDTVGSLYRLLSGVVLLSQVDRNGVSVVSHMVCPGQTLGFRAYIDGGVHGVSAVCATDAVLCSIPADAVSPAFMTLPPLERVFASHVAAELSATEDALLALSTQPVRDRMLMVFARLYRQFGEGIENGGCRLLLPLLRSDIAALAGIARETFSRSMRGLEDEQLVLVDGDEAVFPDMARFRQAAELIQPGVWGD
ncbi:MAG: Crp/Fnr family transcriptional regulator [Magnetospirillum sp.]